MENNDLLLASCGAHGKDGPGGYVTISGATCQSHHTEASNLHLSYPPLSSE